MKQDCIMKKDSPSLHAQVGALFMNYTGITGITIPDFENFNVDYCIDFINGLTISGEGKTCRQNMKTEDGEHWGEYYNLSNPKGLVRHFNMKFCNVPETFDMNEIFDYQPKLLSGFGYEVDNTPMPEALKDKHVFMVNFANSKYNVTNQKYYKLATNGCMLSVLARDGVAVWNPTNLKKALVGYGWVYTYPTEDFKNNGKVWECKALLDMDLATWIPFKAPDNCFE